MLLSFMSADLVLLPDSLVDVYLVSRLLWQIPACFAFFLFSFHHQFGKFYQPALFVTLFSIVISNYWVIVRCWQLEKFAFPYEGTVMYCLFTLFIFRMSYRYAIPFALSVVTGFAIILVNYPIYGAESMISMGFVFVALLVSILGVYQIESALKLLSQANKQLNILSQIDPLTEIYNRRTYEQKFTEQLSLCRRNQNNIIVFIIDLDFFKDYNDGFGHVKGDQIIKKQANHLKQLFRRESDIVARYGGEEFVVVTSMLTLQQAEDLANQIISQWQDVKEPHGKGKAGAYVSCSVGYWIEHVTKQSDKQAMVKKADLALYQAKANGRNCAIRYVE
jgi:diguanylate cyclase (GGDEF)-like protein